MPRAVCLLPQHCQSNADTFLESVRPLVSAPCSAPTESFLVFIWVRVNSRFFVHAVGLGFYAVLRPSQVKFLSANFSSRRRALPPVSVRKYSVLYLQVIGTNDANCQVVWRAWLTYMGHKLCDAVSDPLPVVTLIILNGLFLPETCH